MVKVFLGGTCNESVWRELLIPKLKIDYFNPVVKDWNEDAQKQEIYEREHCDYCLYVITPLMSGVYSIAEVIDDSNKRPGKTILCVLGIDFTENDKEFALQGDSEFKIPWVQTDNLEDILYAHCHGYTWGDEQRRSLEAVEKLAQSNGAIVFDCLDDVADYLNRRD